jgi:hypothetical protein
MELGEKVQKCRTEMEALFLTTIQMSLKRRCERGADLIEEAYELSWKLDEDKPEEAILLRELAVKVEEKIETVEQNLSRNGEAA